MRSMYRFSIIALAIASLALVAAGTAFAEVGVSGSMMGGLSVVKNETKTATTTSNVTTRAIETEAIVNFKAANGPVSAALRLEINDTDQGWNNTRHNIKWSITDAMSLEISGSSFGFKAGSAPFGASVVGDFTASGGIGHEAGNTQLVFAVNDQTADFNFKFGAMDAGVMWSPNDILQGGGAVAADPTAAGAPAGAAADLDSNGNTYTFVPYFNGSFGAINAHVYYAMSENNGIVGVNGFQPGAGLNIKSTEVSLAAIYKGDGMSGVLQIATGDVKGEITKGGSGTFLKTQTINLGFKMAGISAHYITKTWDDDDSTTNDKVTDYADVAVAYSMGISEGAKWTVGVAQRMNKKTQSALANNDQRVMFSLASSY